MRLTIPLRWRHNEHDSVSNHQPHDCLLNRLFTRSSKKTSNSASLAFVWGFHRDRWILRTKGQLRGKCFHLMTSSCEMGCIHFFLQCQVFVHQCFLSIRFAMEVIPGKLFVHAPFKYVFRRYSIMFHVPKFNAEANNIWDATVLCVVGCANICGDIIATGGTAVKLVFRYTTTLVRRTHHVNPTLCYPRHWWVDPGLFIIA